MPKVASVKTIDIVDSKFDPLVPSKFKLPISLVKHKKKAVEKLLPPTSLSSPASASISASEYPTSPSSRSAYLSSPTSKPLTAHQWKVYDYILNIPSGRITTYALLAKGIGSGSQAVGAALKVNPFQPYVPCHRVIATTGYIGGFQGEWLDNLSTTTETKEGEGKPGEGKKVNRKLELLKFEGVEFDEKGYLIDKSKIWSGSD